jgi:hypothetical protein
MYPYPDYLMCWDDGTSIDPELREMLLHGLEPGFAIEHAQFARRGDGSLTVVLRLAVSRGLPRPQIWEIKLSYPAAEATAVHADATPEEREWFTMMVRTHVTEWWQTRSPGVAEEARRVK